MVNDSENAMVICPDCRKQINEKLEWFKTKRTFVHACGAVVEFDYNELKKFLKDQARNAQTHFVGRLVSSNKRL